MLYFGAHQPVERFVPFGRSDLGTLLFSKFPWVRHMAAQSAGLLRDLSSATCNAPQGLCSCLGNTLPVPASQSELLLNAEHQGQCLERPPLTWCRKQPSNSQTHPPTGHNLLRSTYLSLMFCIFVHLLLRYMFSWCGRGSAFFTTVFQCLRYSAEWVSKSMN